MKILLIGWTQRKDIAGGAETVYSYLKKVFPKAELISVQELISKPVTSREAAEFMDKYYLDRYDGDMVIIRDAEIGGVLDTSEIPQFTIYGGPYKAISDLGIAKFKDNEWMTEGSKERKIGTKIAVSNFMKEEVEKIGVEIDEVVPNCVDTDIFKPVDNIHRAELRKKYGLPHHMRTGVWIGDDTQIKNFQMLLNQIEIFSSVFWILITKKEFHSPYANSKVFVNMEQKEVAELLSCGDFFYLTSPIESCGIAWLEAMSTNLPCIVSKTGYFWDYWDNRIGIQVDFNNFNQHADAIEKINLIPTSPREVILENKLDFKSWKKRWKELIEKYK